MGRYARHSARVEESKHPTYGSIWGATVEVEDTDTHTIVKTFQADDRDGREAVRQASSEAMEWINEQNRLVGELDAFEKQVDHVMTAVGAARTTKDREIAKELLDSLGLKISELRVRIKDRLN